MFVKWLIHFGGIITRLYSPSKLYRTLWLPLVHCFGFPSGYFNVMVYSHNSYCVVFGCSRLLFSEKTPVYTTGSASNSKQSEELAGLLAGLL